MLVAYRKRAIDGTLEVWLPRLVESNYALEQGLLLLCDLYGTIWLKKMFLNGLRRHST
jgi:hypothetical protein